MSWGTLDRVSFPFAMVRHGRDDVPVLLGLDGRGNLAGLDVVEGRFLALDPGDVGVIFDTDPAAVYAGVQLAWAGERQQEQIAAEGSNAEEIENPYHGSNDCLPVGTVLKPRHRFATSDTERALERHRPEGVLSRKDAVWITRTPGGVFHAGGGSIYVYKVEPIGPKYGPYDGAWVGRMNFASDPKQLDAMADAYWRGIPCKGTHCYGAHEYLVGSARIVEVVAPSQKGDPDVASCSGDHEKWKPAVIFEAIQGLPEPKRAELGRKFEPMLTRDPFSVPVSGFDAVRSQLIAHREHTPSIETIRLTTIFAGLTVGVGIAQAEQGFQCLVDLFAHGEPPIGKVRGCIWSLGYHQIRERLYSEVPRWAPLVRDALARGLRDRELREHLFLHTETPAGISLAKLSFVLALLGQNLVCLDVRILDRMFGPHMASRYGGTWDTPTQLSLARYERVEDAFLRFNPFYRPSDPIGRARAQWLSWESAGKPARVETHAVWLNVVRGTSHG